MQIMIIENNIGAEFRKDSRQIIRADLSECCI